MPWTSNGHLYRKKTPNNKLVLKDNYRAHRNKAVSYICCLDRALFGLLFQFPDAEEFVTSIRVLCVCFSCQGRLDAQLITPRPGMSVSCVFYWISIHVISHFVSHFISHFFGCRFHVSQRPQPGLLRLEFTAGITEPLHITELNTKHDIISRSYIYLKYI